MKSFLLVVLLLFCAPFLRADDAAPTREQLQVQLQENTASIDAWKKQVGANDTGDKAQETYGQLAVAYQKRAVTNEKLENWKDAASDWYSADSMRSKLYLGKYQSIINGEASFRTYQANDQINANDWEGADRSMEAARRGKGWDKHNNFMSFLGARINLFFNRPDAALADALDTKALNAQKGKVPDSTYTAIGLAYYQKGDLQNAQANWDEVLKMVPNFAKVEPFSEDGARFNAAVAQNPQDPKVWLERGRFYHRFGDQFYKDYDKTAEKPGSWLINPQTLTSFNAGAANLWNAAQRDYTRSLELARTPLTLALRAQALFKIGSTRADLKKGFFPPTQSWTADEKAAFDLGYNDFEAMNILSELHQDRAYRIEGNDGAERQRRAAQKKANFYASLALLHNPLKPSAAISYLLESAADDLIYDTEGEPINRTPETAKEWKDLGNEYRGKGDLQHALESYEKALEVNPQYADAQNNIGTIYGDAGDHERSIAAFRAAIALEPEHRVAHKNLANDLQKMKFLSEALKEAEAGVKFATPDFKASALETRGDIRYLTNDRAGALSDWRAEVALDPTRISAWRAIGKVSLGDADILAAREAFQKTLELQPKDDFNKILLATALNISEFQKAAKAQGKTVEAMNSDEREKIRPEAAQILGDLRAENRADWEILKDLWDELFKGTAMDKNEANRPLAASGKSVFRTVVGAKALVFEGSAKD